MLDRDHAAARQSSRRTRCPGRRRARRALLRSQIHAAVTRAEAVRQAPGTPPPPPGPARDGHRSRGKRPSGGPGPAPPVGRRGQRISRRCRAAGPGPPRTGQRREHQPSTSPSSRPLDGHRHPSRPLARQAFRSSPVLHRAAGHPRRPSDRLWMRRRRCGQLRAEPGCARGSGRRPAYAERRTSSTEVTSRVRAPVRTPAPGPTSDRCPGWSRDPRPVASSPARGPRSGLRRDARAVPPTGAPRQPCARPRRAAPDRR